MMDEDVAGADGGPEVGSLGELRHGLWHELGVAQVRVAGQVMDLEQAGQVEQPGVADDVGRVEVEGAREELFDLRGGVGLDLEPDGSTAAALADLLLNSFE